MRQLTVDLGERSYPIYIGGGLTAEAGDYFEKHDIGKGSRHLLVTDRHVAGFHLERVQDSLRRAGYSVSVYIVEPGEKSKSLAVFEDVISAALRGGLDRSSAIIALGGGVIGDLAGFAAASYMRGIRFVQMPTTILAHDSSVGGKVAVNHPMAKNIIGAFHQPVMVLYDIDTLKTLPLRDVREGLSEVIKHGLIWDRNFVDWVDAHAEDLQRLDPEALEYALHEGCRIKSIVVSQDEREGGLRAILNLGHTFGHAFEAVAGYNGLHHGEAIAIGMVGAAKLAVRLGRPAPIYTETKRILAKLGLPVSLDAGIDEEEIMRAMAHDKKFKEGGMTFIVPLELGKVEINSSISSGMIRPILAELKKEG